MKLCDTVSNMIHTDYKRRFLAEYQQVRIREEGLRETLRAYKKRELAFKLSCPYDLLRVQLFNMKKYREVLEERAKIEKIDLHYI